MRIWDVNPGFLNDKSLLGEHRELHGIFSILTNGKKGYSRHPETLRWQNCMAALVVRHALLVSEMRLRDFNHHSPLSVGNQEPVWPKIFIDSPGRQYKILHDKYSNKACGRIPLPKNSQELWAQHKYSVMARDYKLYQQIGRRVAKNSIAFDELALGFVSLLQSPPSNKGLQNSLLHMWGYISKFSDLSPTNLAPHELILEIQSQSKQHKAQYLLFSTALGELAL
nr:DUF1722 domain-containing protein [Desulfobulbaceae bacterium]